LRYRLCHRVLLQLHPLRYLRAPPYRSSLRDPLRLSNPRS
jgi:hypothetical protein